MADAVHVDEVVLTCAAQGDDEGQSQLEGPVDRGPGALPGELQDGALRAVTPGQGADHLLVPGHDRPQSGAGGCRAPDGLNTLNGSNDGLADLSGLAGPAVRPGGAAGIRDEPAQGLGRPREVLTDQVPPPAAPQEQERLGDLRGNVDREVPVIDAEDASFRLQRTDLRAGGRRLRGGEDRRGRAAGRGCGAHLVLLDGFGWGKGGGPGARGAGGAGSPRRCVSRSS